MVGISQIGAESDWRNANTESIQAELTEENGYYLIFDDAQQKQAGQRFFRRQRTRESL